MGFDSDDHLGGAENVEAESGGSNNEPFRPSVTSLADARIPNKPSVIQSTTGATRTIAQAIEHMVVVMRRTDRLWNAARYAMKKMKVDGRTVYRKIE